MRWKAVLVAILSVLLMACEGPVGPPGPPGPAGPQGERGPGTRIVLDGRVALDGSAIDPVPTGAGTMNDPPSLVCYVGQSPDGPFLQVSTEFLLEITCGLLQSGGRLHAVMTGAPAGWYYRFVVVH